MLIITPQGFSYDISPSGGDTTIDGATTLLVTVLSKFTEVITYTEAPARTTYTVSGPIEEARQLLPISSVFLTNGAHVLRKHPGQYVRASAKAHAVAIRIGAN